MGERTTKPLPYGHAHVRWVDEPKPLRWDGYQGATDGDYHIIPQNDDRNHTCNRHCWCDPLEQDGRKWIHQSFDRREDYEQGYRKVN